MLENVDLTKKVPKQEWQSRKLILQDRLYNVAKTCWDSNTPVCVIFEGWDTSGKGTCIKYITERQDPRGFIVHRVTAPRTHEQQYPWLWRFWQILPNDGQIAILDNSWYRRVLREHIEGEVTKKACIKSYEDIIGLEHMLSDDGMVFIKFWLHISKEEQKKRLKNMEKGALAWKVTKEDWKQNKQYNRYCTAAEEMIARTDTEWGAWHIVGATDAKYTRIKVLETIIETLESTLKERGSNVVMHRSLQPEDKSR